MRSLAPILSVWLACGAAQEPVEAPKPKATLADLSWLDGMWRGPMLDERWLHVGGALYGVALNDSGFEVNLVDDNDDDGRPSPITLTSYPNGRDPSSFVLVRATPELVELADPAHRTVRFTKTAHGIRGEFLDPPRPPVGFALEGDTIPGAPELETADREFAIATATDGPEGWARYFRADGAIWRGQRVEGPDAIRAAMTKTLDHHVLAWRPMASGKRGAWGFTLGVYEYSPLRGATQAHGSYCTIWHQDSDGWKVAFDIGHPAGED